VPGTEQEYESLCVARLRDPNSIADPNAPAPQQFGDSRGPLHQLGERKDRLWRLNSWTIRPTICQGNKGVSEIMGHDGAQLSGMKGKGG
jgi:hypothetical protein